MQKNITMEETKNLPVLYCHIFCKTDDAALLNAKNTKRTMATEMPKIFPMFLIPRENAFKNRTTPVKQIAAPVKRIRKLSI